MSTAPAEPSSAKIVVPAAYSMVGLLGASDAYLRALERAVPELDILVRGNEILLTGDEADVTLIEQAIAEMLAVLRTGQALSAEAVDRLIGMLRDSSGVRPADVLTANILSNRGKSIRPKTLNQKRYVDAIEAKRITRIVLTRPAVEAGEHLGFLPGSLSEKIDPYLRPLYDALHDMIDPDSIPRLMTSGVIEVAPLAYMRGRTLNDAFIILDEAQNTSPEQMKMFLTRLGFGSTMVVTGDTTQVDLPSGVRSGLEVVQEILTGVEDIHFSRLTSHDVVRHKLVGRIVDAYAHWDAQRSAPGAHQPASRRTT
ncbi:MAG: PhoH family protein [Actinobacteria bacterium]|nr:PhoH family protein [Actinomycetota bacterium]